MYFSGIFGSKFPKSFPNWKIADFGPALAFSLHEFFKQMLSHEAADCGKISVSNSFS